MKNKVQDKPATKKRTFAHMKKASDTTVIRKHLMSLDNETIKTALIASGMYDSNMKLTPSFR